MTACRCTARRSERSDGSGRWCPTPTSRSLTETNGGGYETPAERQRPHAGFSAEYQPLRKDFSSAATAAGAMVKTVWSE